MEYCLIEIRYCHYDTQPKKKKQVTKLKNITSGMNTLVDKMKTRTIACKRTMPYQRSIDFQFLGNTLVLLQVINSKVFPLL